MIERIVTVEPQEIVDLSWLQRSRCTSTKSIGKTQRRTRRDRRTSRVSLLLRFVMIETHTHTHSRRVHDRVAKRWYDVCAKNGGLYVKLGQSVNTLAHILPPEYLKYFEGLLDQAPQASFEDVKKIVDEDLGSSIEEKFEHFEPVAIASASIAQVHRARLKDGTEVAVKIQKPWIQKQLPFDLACYRILVFLLEKAFDLPMFWTTKTVCDVITAESDFRIEALNSERAKRNWNSSPTWRDRIYVPNVFSEFTAKRVMVQEFVKGRKINEIVKLEREGYDRKEIAEYMIGMFAGTFASFSLLPRNKNVVILIQINQHHRSNISHGFHTW